MSSTPDWKILDRYLAGEASPDEQALVRSWTAADARLGATLEWLRTQSPAVEPDFDSRAAWTKFSRKNDMSPTRTLPFRRRVSPIVWRMAAVLVLAIGVTTFWRTARRDTPAAPTQWREVFTLGGQRTTTTLDDGTRVALNAGSRLRYASTYGVSSRDVYLDGEGYFEVVHDEKRPFRVHARSSVIEDLGTRFTVRAYAEQATMEIAVTEGLVALTADSAIKTPAVQLRPGDVARLDSTGIPAVSHVGSLDRYTAWTSGTLMLDGLTLRDAARELERWYNVQITIADSALASRPVVARFRGESVTQALDAIAFALAARYEQQGSTYTFSRRK